MFKFRSHNEQNTEPTVDKKALIFGLMSVFLCGIGFTIIAPVVPFLVQPYISNPGDQAITYVFNYGRPRHHFPRFDNAKAFAET